MHNFEIYSMIGTSNSRHTISGLLYRKLREWQEADSYGCQLSPSDRNTRLRSYQGAIVNLIIKVYF